MALSLVNEDRSALRLAADWPAVQFAQFEHDEKYHPEISRLSIQARLRHMALHFAKYAGRAHDKPTDEAFKRLATDSLIIAISCANALNIDLSKADLPVPPMQEEQFAIHLTVAAGRMCEACERLDHLEDFPFRPAIIGQVLCILVGCLGMFQTRGWSPVEEMRNRLGPIKAKKLFHGKL